MEIINERRSVLTSDGRTLIELPREKSFNKSKPWNIREDEMLKIALEEGMVIKELSDLLGRTIKSIYSRKTILINEGYLKKDVRFKSPKGSLRKAINKRVSEEDLAKKEQAALLKKYMEKAQAKQIQVIEEIQPEIKEAITSKDQPEIDMKSAKDFLDLEALASAATDKNVIITVTFSSEKTEIVIRKNI